MATTRYVRPLIDGWVGYADGASVLVATAETLPANLPVVAARPELFEPIDENVWQVVRGRDGRLARHLRPVSRDG